MPSFYSSNTHALPPQMPPTPPSYYDLSFGSVRDNRQLPALQLTTSAQNSKQELGRSEERGIMPQYSQYTHNTVTRPAHPQENNRHALSSYSSSSQGSSNAYGVASASLLPPIRVPDRSMEDYQQHLGRKRAQAVAQPKEEKAMGGVAAHLDYEMEDMVDFVSETAQGIVVDSKSPVHPEFRKYVSQVLSSTRLPRSTILLGLHYLAKRMTMLSNEGNFNYGSGQVHRMLTMALVLGSKFLDDNTFQNRSWSEVSNIPVRDLNILEVEWLVAIDWDMHINHRDPEGFLLWHQQWRRYQVNKAAQIDPLVQSLQQTHLDSGFVERQRSVHQRSSPTNRYPLSYAERAIVNGFQDNSHSQWATPSYDSWPPLRTQTDYSPPSAPETGPNTPEWYSTHSGFGYGRAPQAIHPALKMPEPVQVVGSNAPQSGYLTPFAQQYNPYGHGITCPCGYCLPHHERCTMAPGYGPQSVVG